MNLVLNKPVPISDDDGNDDDGRIFRDTLLFNPIPFLRPWTWKEDLLIINNIIVGINIESSNG